MRDLDEGIAKARGGDIDQGLLWMAKSLREAPAERPDLIRSARANLPAWSDGAFPLAGDAGSPGVGHAGHVHFRRPARS